MVDIKAHPPAPATLETATSNVPPATSLVDSEKTVSARLRPREMTARPVQGAAVFSTDNGRRPHRGPPYPLPPVIVRSDKIISVVQFANYWREKYPYYYHRFFPRRGWVIDDLWDEADIYVESPEFLQQVLYFITHDNVAHAQNFAAAWSQKHHDKMDVLGGDISHFNDPNDGFAIVDKMFTNGERDDYPRDFLFEVLEILRETMRVYGRKYLAPQPTASVRLPADTRTSAKGIENGSSHPMPGEHAVVAEVKQHPPMFARSREASLPPTTSLYADMLTEPALVNNPYTSPVVVPSAHNSPLTRHPSFGPPQPQRPFLNRGGGPPMIHNAARMPNHNGGQIYNTRRPARSGSAQFTQQPHLHGMNENIHLGSGNHMRQSSGHIPNGPMQHFVPPMPMGPGMMNPLNPGPQFPPNFSMTSPAMHHPSQMQYAQIIPPGAMVPPPVPFAPPPNDPAYQQFNPGDFGQRIGPFVDMANNMQYPPARGSDARGMPQRNNQASRPVALYNPYGAERPDKAGFATTGIQSGGRRGSRNNYPSNMGKGRKHSAGTLDRSGHGPYVKDHPDNNVRPSGGHNIEGSQPRGASYQYDEHIINDSEYGCHTHWIGPKNDTVRQLYVKNIPGDVQGREIEAVIRQIAGVTPSNLELKRSSYNDEVSHAFVHFSSPDEARQALKADNALVRDRQMQVSVARRYFSASRITTQNSYRSANNSATPAEPFQYSPQDARSDLHRLNLQQQQQENPATHGSPEVRKAKKNQSAKKSQNAREGQTADDWEVGAPSSSAPGPSTGSNFANVSTDMHKLSADSQHESGTDQVGILETADVKLGGTVDLKPMKSSPVDTLAKERNAEVSIPYQTSSTEGSLIAPKSRSDPTPTDQQPSNFCSSTKIALMPSSDSGQHEQQNEEAFTEVEKDEDVAVTPRAQVESTSDDDQKNDLSFHSAQESQPDVQKTEAQTPFRKNDANTSDELSVLAQLTDEKVESGRPHKELDVGTTGTSEPDDLEEKDTASMLGKGLNDTGRKQGAKRTESLHPFAKSSRSQIKKEKQAKKKDKSKEKEKAKAEPGNQGEVQNQEKSVSEKDPDEKKITRGVPHVATNEIHLQSNDDNETKELQAQQSGKVTSEPCLDEKSSTAVWPHEKDHVATSGTAESVAPPSVQHHAREPEKKVKVAPLKIAVPAIPSIKHSRVKPSPPSATEPPHTAYFSVASSSSDKASSAHNSVEMPPIQQDEQVPSGASAQDSVSVASSSTLRGPSPPPMSVSSPAKEFHTPLQTPTALPSLPAEGTKKKKPKRKKKTKATGNTEEAVASGAVEDAFHDQLSQIANAQTGYYALRDGNLPEKEEFELPKEDKGPKSLIRQVHAYVREKASGYARVSESAWSKDRMEVEPMTPREMQALISQEEQDNPGLIHYLEDEFLPEGSLEKAGKAGAVPLFGE
ncbi:hypothetical protein N0V90_005456 [Kalmusia sp. IMI 367209]|nr:hypothetical protein N0V90_005456 [Kalmusia sp. IMI 367209]